MALPLRLFVFVPDRPVLGLRLDRPMAIGKRLMSDQDPHKDHVRKGGCLCGKVRFEVTGRPLLVEFCHCQSCRKASGAPIFAWAAFAVSAFGFSSGAPKTRLSSPGVTRGFCGDCGTPLTLQDERFADEIYVALAAFDDPESFEPAFHIWRSHRLPWLETADDLPRYRRFRYQGELED